MSWLSKLLGTGGEKAPAVSVDAEATGSDALLDAQTLGRLGSIDMIAQTVVDGVMSGKHRSTHRGGCCEFSEHRPYTQGDETRLIDWRLFARRDRHYVKLFDDETNLHAWLVVDTSGSMAFGRSTVSKFDYARVASACLGRLLLRQRDSVGLLTTIDGRRVHLPARPQPSHFHGVCEALRLAEPRGAASIVPTLAELPNFAKRRGMILIFSDCFGPLEPMVDALKLLRLRGHDVMVFQVLAPEEQSFDIRGSSIFEDLEKSSTRLRLNPGLIRRRYLERFGEFQQRLQNELVRADVDICRLSTDGDLANALSHYLSYRAAKVRALARA